MSHQHDDAIEALLRKQFDGPVPNDGFSERVMQRLPSRRRRMVWPLWAGIVVGMGACWLSLLSAPLLHVGWRDWMGGELSAPAITLLLAIAGMSLLASWWSVAEAMTAEANVPSASPDGGSNNKAVLTRTRMPTK